MEFVNSALQLAKEQLVKRRSNLECQKDGIAWLDAHLPKLPEVSHINCFEGGEIAVTFTIYGSESTPEELAAKIRASLGVRESTKDVDIFSKDSLRLVTMAPTEACVIRLVVPGAEITQGCKLEPQTYTTYKLVCSE